MLQGFDLKLKPPRVHPSIWIMESDVFTRRSAECQVARAKRSHS